MKIIPRAPILISTCPQCPHYTHRVMFDLVNRAQSDVRFCLAFETEIVTGDAIPAWCQLKEATKEEEKEWSTPRPTTPA